MAEALILLGALCVVTAIVGGGLEIASLGKMPVVDSPGRQLILALCGAALVAGGLALRTADGSSVNPPGNALEEPAMKVTPKTARPGTRLTVDARGFLPGEPVTVEFRVEELGSFTANSQGRIADEHVRIPRDYDFARREDIRAHGHQSGITVSRQIEIKCRKGYKRQQKVFCVEPGSLQDLDGFEDLGGFGE